MVNPEDLKEAKVSTRDRIKTSRARRTRCTCPYCKEGKNQVPDGKKQHICHIPGCNKIYGKTSHLRDHLHWHSGERPFVCNWLYCGKRFHRSDKLHRHSRTHTGEKSYECPECGKGFMRSDHLTKHMRIHTKNKQSEVVVKSEPTVYSETGEDSCDGMTLKYEDEQLDDDDEEEKLENMIQPDNHVDENSVDS